MPERTCSATRTDMNKPKHSTAGTKDDQGGGICLIASPQAWGNSSGKTKYHRNICTNKGMLRNNSV